MKPVDMSPSTVAQTKLRQADRSDAAGKDDVATPDRGDMYVAGTRRSKARRALPTRDPRRTLQSAAATAARVERQAAISVASSPPAAISVATFPRQTLAAIVDGSFNPRNEADPREIARVVVQPSPTHDRARNVVKTYEVTFLDSHDNRVGTPATFSLEKREQQDVLDLLPYHERDGKIFVGVNERLRPAVAARALFAHQDPLPLPPPLMDNAPAAYIRVERGESSLNRTADGILKNKLGLKAHGPLEFLGGSYFTSAGGGTEVCWPRAVRVQSADDGPRVKYGADLEGEVGVRFVELADILRAYLSGKMQDTRLAELAFRLADLKGVKLGSKDLGVDEPSSLGLTQQTATRAIDVETARAIESRIATRAQLRQLVNTTSQENGKITHISLREIDTPANPFMKSETVRVENRNAAGEKLHTYDCDIVRRKTLDSVDVGAYFWHNGRLYMPIKRGVRPSAVARDLLAHPLHSRLSPINLEGIAGTLEGGTSLKDIAQLAVHEVQEEANVTPISTPVFVGADYPSPGVNPERAYRFLVEVDPARPASGKQTVDETVDVHYVDVDDILRLADQGILRDHRLTLNAHLLKAMFNYTSPDTPDHAYPARDVADFQALINSGSKLQEWLAEPATREVDAKLHQIALYRRLKLYCENELGLVADKIERPAESGFFTPMLPIFAVPGPDDKRKLPFYLLHDLRHYTVGDYVPFKPTADGGFELLPLRDYQRACATNECWAVSYSDDIIPRRYGIEDAHKIFGGLSVAHVLSNLGLSEDEGQKAIISIELNGHIPDAIVKHPKYEEYRPVLVDRLLRYHIMDAMDNEAAYKTWVDNPEVAATAFRFCHVYNDVPAFEARCASSLKEITEYSEGANPLKAALSRAVNFEIRVTALRLAYLKQCVAAAGKPGAEKVGRDVQAAIDGLHDAMKVLVAHRDRVHDIDLTKENMEAFQDLRKLQGSVIKDAERMADTLAQDRRHLTDAQVKDLDGRRMPYIRRGKLTDTAAIDRALDELERKNLARVGVK